MIEKKRRFGKVKTIKKINESKRHKIRFVCEKRSAETMRSHV